MPVSIPSNTLEKFTTFGDLLRFIRRRVGITQTELAAVVGYSDGQISRLEQNLRLPDLATISSRFVTALGLEDEPKVVARLLDLAANVRREDAPGLGLCPYKGLSYFDEADADLFVGREALTEKLAQRVLSLASGSNLGPQRFLAIVGASGSGKSSLARAGLVPALRWDPASVNWPIHIFTPTAHPLENLAAVLTDEDAAARTLAGDLTHDEGGLHTYMQSTSKPADASHWLLVVDQFEELFTLCHSETERASFIGNLLFAAAEAGGPGVIVLTLRADLYAHCANHPALREALARQQEYIGAMTDEELRRAIEEPARRGRWEFEPGLVELLLHDVGHEPGALPLLSHALLETWQRRRGRRMTLSGYASSGGVRGAIAETAEAVFADQFTQQQQEIARRIFLRLTELGDETASSDTRRRATFEELILKPEEAGTTRAVLKALADARLIITTEDSAEVAHEALIREWPTLRGWLEDDREALRVHRHITEAAREWLASDRHMELLYRSGRLAQALEWRHAYPDEINTQEREFLEASERRVEQEAAEKEAQRQFQLEAAQKLAEAEGRRAEEQAFAARRLRKRAFYLAGALIAALAMGLTALFFGTQARQAARTEQAQQRIAFSRELAAAATGNLDVDPERSLLLSMEAVSVTYSTDKTWSIEAEQALRRALLASRLQLTLRAHTDRVMAAAFSPDDRSLATTSDDGTLRVWDAETGQEMLVISTHATRGRHGLAFSPDGTRLASGAESGTARIWNAATGEEVIALRGHTDWVTAMSFSPDGRQLATASEDRTVRVRDPVTGRELLVLRGHSAVVLDVAFSPDGKLIASAGEDAKIRLWEAASGAALSSLSGHTGPVNAVAFSPDGARIASAGADRTARVWDAATGRELLTIRGHTNAVTGIAFGPDGKRLATASADGTARVWDAITGQEILSLKGHAGPVVGLAFSRGCMTQAQAMIETCGSRLATAGLDGTARIWDISPSRELLTISTPDASAGRFSADGKQLAVGTMNGAVKVWDLNDPLERALDGNGIGKAGELLITGGEGIPVRAIVFSRDGTLIASAGDDHTVRLWDLKSRAELLTLRGHTATVGALAFSPDGTRLATSSLDYTVKTWDLTRATGGVPFLRSISLPAWSYALTFSPDGKRLAAGSNDGMVKVWDMDTGKELLSWRGHSSAVWSIAFSPDGTRLATASDDRTGVIWEAATGRELVRLSGHSGEVNAIAFSPDGTRLATASQDGTAKLWDGRTGREMLSLYGSASALIGVAFSEDGRRLAATDDDGVTRFYLLRVEDLLALGHRRVTRGITQEECLQYLHRSEEQCAQKSASSTQAAPTSPVQANAQPENAKGRVCLVTDEAGINDQFYNEIAHKGIQDATRVFAWQAAVLESRQQADYEKQLTNAMQIGCSLIVLSKGYPFSDLTWAAAKMHPDQKFQIVEAVFDEPLENVWEQEYAVDQAAFLAGYTAASVTKTGKVGTFGGVNYPAVTAYMDGFARGVAYYNQMKQAQVELLGWDLDKQDGLFAETFVNIEVGRETGQQLMEQGVDVILPVAGPVGLGAAAAAREHGGVYIIGVDTNWAVTYPEFADVILTSIEKRMDASVLSAVEAIENGMFTGGIHLGTLENGGVSLAPFHELEALVSAGTREELEQITAEIIAGRIKTKGSE